MSRNHKETVYVHHKGKSNRHNRLRSCTRDVLTCHVTIRKPSMSTTGSPSSSCEMIILRNNSHGVIIRVCMGIFTAVKAVRSRYKAPQNRRREADTSCHKEADPQKTSYQQCPTNSIHVQHLRQGLPFTHWPSQS